MIVISGTAIFWFVALGLLTGWIFGMIIKKEGIPLWGNIIWGIIGSILTGIIGISLEFGDGLLFAFVYTIAILFIVNVFHQHHKEDIYGHIDRGIRIVKTK